MVDGNGLAELKSWYFQNIDKEDAKLIATRDRSYAGVTADMIEAYRKLRESPQANEEYLDGAIAQLEALEELETRLLKRGSSISGQSVNLTLLVDLFEPDRGNGRKTRQFPNVLL